MSAQRGTDGTEPPDRPAAATSPRSTSRSLRARRFQQLRDELMSTAAELFTTRGFAKVTVEDIAAEAGVAARTVYRHFAGGKDELALAPLRDPLRLAASALRERKDDDPLQGIAAAVDAARSAAVPDELTRRLAIMVSRDPWLAGRHAADGAILEDELVRYLQRCDPHRPPLQVSLLSAALVAALRTAYRLSQQSGSERALQEALRIARALLAAAGDGTRGSRAEHR
jgi:AcrR family transcriptional regulator